MTTASTRRPVGRAAALALLGLLALEAPARADEAIEVQMGRCSTVLDRAKLQESLVLGSLYLLQHQKREGSFTYEFDWVEGTYSTDDNSVRQAGAAWGLALLLQEFPGEEMRRALDRALAFFERHSRTTEDGARYVAYPGESRGHLGAVALVALTHIDYLRVAREHLPAPRVAELEARMDEYLRFLVRAHRDEGLFHARYRVEDGTPEGDPSPYSDGESLLALTKAARYLGREHLRPLALAEAQAGYLANNVGARRENPDSPVTKGYYQWSSMAYFELATSGWEGTERYAFRLIELADWMIDIHRTLDRRLNTAYAYEGIVPAFRMAALVGDRIHAEKFACVMERGLAKLTSWQVGHSLANRFIRRHVPPDPRAIGGIQNGADLSPLRIDVTQHQMHAVILARRYYWTGETRTEETTP